MFAKGCRKVGKQYSSILMKPTRRHNVVVTEEMRAEIAAKTKAVAKRGQILMVCPHR